MQIRSVSECVVRLTPKAEHAGGGGLKELKELRKMKGLKGLKELKIIKQMKIKWIGK